MVGDVVLELHDERVPRLPGGAENDQVHLALRVDHVPTPDRGQELPDPHVEPVAQREVTEPTALAPVLRRALDFVDGQAREKSLTVRGEFPTVPTARCDPEQVYQVRSICS